MAKKYTLDELEEIDQQFKELVEMKTQYYILVDKQLSTRKAIANILKNNGIEVDFILEASDAYETTSKIENGEKEYFVFTELKLPDIDGFKLIERIRKKFPDVSVKFIIVTSDASKQNFVKSTKMGAIGFIKKPFSPDEMVENLKKIGILDGGN